MNARLQAMADTLNTITKSPREPYRKEGERNRANVGNYHISGCYGGYSLHRMMNEDGGIRDVLATGHISAKELGKAIDAYTRGLRE